MLEFFDSPAPLRFFLVDQAGTQFADAIFEATRGHIRLRDGWQHRQFAINTYLSSIPYAL